MGSRFYGFHWKEENCDKGAVADTEVGLSGQRGDGFLGFLFVFFKPWKRGQYLADQQPLSE